MSVDRQGPASFDLFARDVLAGVQDIDGLADPAAAK